MKYESNKRMEFSGTVDLSVAVEGGNKNVVAFHIGQSGAGRRSIWRRLKNEAYCP